MSWVLVEIMSFVSVASLVILSIHLHEIWLSKMSWSKRKRQLQKIKDRNGRRWPY